MKYVVATQKMSLHLLFNPVTEQCQHSKVSCTVSNHLTSRLVRSHWLTIMVYSVGKQVAKNHGHQCSQQMMLQTSPELNNSDREQHVTS